MVPVFLPRLLFFCDLDDICFELGHKLATIKRNRNDFMIFCLFLCPTGGHRSEGAHNFILKLLILK